MAGPTRQPLLDSGVDGLIDDGTMCRAISSAPGPVGGGPSDRSWWSAPAPEKNFEDEAQLDELRWELRQALNQMIREVAADAALFEKQLEQEGVLAQGLVYTGAFLSGLYSAGKGIVVTAKDVVVGAANAYVTIAKWEHRARVAVLRAMVSGDLTEIRTQLNGLAERGGEVAESAQALYETLELLHDDPQTWQMLSAFPDRYWSSLHSTRKTEMVGSLSFDILLALLTAGVGVAASALSKSRYFRRAAEVIQDIVAILRRRRKPGTAAHGPRPGVAPAKSKPTSRPAKPEPERPPPGPGLAEAPVAKPTPKATPKPTPKPEPKFAPPKPAGAVASAKRASNQTVLGSYPHYVKLSDELGARRFEIPMDAWNRMTPDQQWAANRKFLDRAIAKGDEIILSNSGHAAQRGTVFFKEVQYMKSQGFRLSEDGLRMMKPGG